MNVVTRVTRTQSHGQMRAFLLVCEEIPDVRLLFFF